MDTDVRGPDHRAGRPGARAWRFIARVLHAALLIAFPIHSEEFFGRVVGIADGDTITVLAGVESRRVRLAGIDAPEKGQLFSQRARQATSQLVFGRTGESLYAGRIAMAGRSAKSCCRMARV